jgi:hypothetical protein
LPAASDERSTARRFEEAKPDEASLIAFLRAMPKGGDLHNHVGGALWGEESLEQAVAAGLYFNPRSSAFEVRQEPGSVPARQLLADDRIRYQYLNATSIRGGVLPGAGGHDGFFGATFRALASGWQGRADVEEAILASVVRRAELQNVQYLELMHWPGGPVREKLLSSLPEGESNDARWTRLQTQLPEFVTNTRAALDRWDRVIGRDRGDGEVKLTAAERGLTVRYLASGFRVGSDERLFATWAGAFAVMKADPRLVGVNLVAPEDHPTALSGFSRQMGILDFLWKRFEQPNVSLHAGELNLLLAPPEALTHHIRRSIEVGHARRIGHGTAVAWEDHVDDLLRTMRERGIAVEVCPSSAAVILGLEGDRHPFRLYRRAGVPITLCTDDEGILRTNLTMEWVRAVRSWGLGYRDLKEFARNSLEYSFLPGESVFEGRDYRRVRERYRDLARRGWRPTEGEKRALAGSDRATVQVRLERALVEFER